MIDRPECVATDVPLSPYTTFRIGGSADYFAHIRTEAELVEVVGWAQAQGLSIMTLGGGSNVVFADTGYRGLVIYIAITGITQTESKDKVIVTANAGEDWDCFVEHTVLSGLSGLENLSGIPGSVGASPVQNIGAYGVEVGELIVSVRVYDLSKNIFINVKNKTCAFSYRDSLFKTNEGKKFIIVSVTYLLNSKFSPNLEYSDVKKYFDGLEPTLPEVRKVILKIRSQKFPDLSRVGTAGSYFKNPIVSWTAFKKIRVDYPELVGHPHGPDMKISAAWLIDKVAKAKGLIDGNVGTHVAQALVFVNYGGATADELDAFAERIADTVFDKTKIKLEREVCFVGEK